LFCPICSPPPPAKIVKLSRPTGTAIFPPRLFGAVRFFCGMDFPLFFLLAGPFRFGFPLKLEIFTCYPSFSLCFLAGTFLPVAPFKWIPLGVRRFTPCISFCTLARPSSRYHLVLRRVLSFVSLFLPPPHRLPFSFFRKCFSFVILFPPRS